MRLSPVHWLLIVLAVLAASDAALVAWLEASSRPAFVTARLATAGVVALLLGGLALVRGLLNLALARDTRVRDFRPMPLLPPLWPAAVVPAVVLSDLDMWFRVLPDDRPLLVSMRIVSIIVVLVVVVVLVRLRPHGSQ